MSSSSAALTAEQLKKQAEQLKKQAKKQRQKEERAKQKKEPGTSSPPSIAPISVEQMELALGGSGLGPSTGPPAGAVHAVAAAIAATAIAATEVTYTGPALAAAPAKSTAGEAKGLPLTYIEAKAMDVDVDATSEPSTRAPSVCDGSEAASSIAWKTRGTNKAKPLEGIPEHKLGAGKKV